MVGTWSLNPETLEEPKFPEFNNLESTLKVVGIWKLRP